MDRRAVIRGMSFARQLPDAVIDDLSAGIGMQSAERGTVITMEGEPAEAMYLVATGRVKIVRHSAEGREQILHVAQASDHFNMVPVFDGGRCPATTETLEPTTLLVLRRETLFELVERHPQLAMALARELALRLRGLVALVDDLALHTVNGRLARLLLEQAQAAAHGQPQPPMTQAEMASHLGTVREMVGRALKSFEAAGLISLDRGTISIRDEQKLREQAEL